MNYITILTFVGKFEFDDCDFDWSLFKLLFYTLCFANVYFA